MSDCGFRYTAEELEELAKCTPGGMDNEKFDQAVECLEELCGQFVWESGEDGIGQINMQKADLERAARHYAGADEKHPSWALKQELEFEIASLENVTGYLKEAGARNRKKLQRWLLQMVFLGVWVPVSGSGTFASSGPAARFMRVACGPAFVRAGIRFPDDRTVQRMLKDQDKTRQK